MSDFIREVDEEYRQDQFRKFLVRYWPALLFGAVLILAGAGAWRGTVYLRQQQAEAAGDRYFDAVEQSRDNPGASLPALDALAKDGPAGYRLLARMRAAGELGKTDPAGGAKGFDAIAADTTVDSDLRDVAALRAGILMVDTADTAELHRRLDPLADANSTYRDIAREMLAVAALKRGDDTEAGKDLDTIVADPTTPGEIRQRAGFYLSLVRSGKTSPAAPATVETTTPAAPTPAPAQVPETPATPQPSAGQPATTAGDTPVKTP